MVSGKSNIPWWAIARVGRPVGQAFLTFAAIAFGFWLQSRLPEGSWQWLTLAGAAVCLAAVCRWLDVQAHWKVVKWHMVLPVLNYFHKNKLPITLFEPELPRDLKYQKPMSFLFPLASKLEAEDRILFGYVRPSLPIDEERFCRHIYMPPGEWCVIVLWDLPPGWLLGYKIFTAPRNMAQIDEYNPYRKTGTRRNWHGVLHYPLFAPPGDTHSRQEVLGFKLSVQQRGKFELVIQWNMDGDGTDYEEILPITVI